MHQPLQDVSAVDVSVTFYIGMHIFFAYWLHNDQRVWYIMC